MRSAMRLRMTDRSATEVRPQAGAAWWAASSAFSTSTWVERCTSHRGFPVMGDGLVNVLPSTEGTNCPLMKLP